MPIILVKKGPEWRKQRFNALKNKADAKDQQHKVEDQEKLKEKNKDTGSQLSDRS